MYVNIPYIDAIAMIVFSTVFKSTCYDVTSRFHFSFLGSSLEIMWFNPLPGSKIGSCSRHQSPGLSPQARAVLWMTHPILGMDGRYEMWKFTCFTLQTMQFCMMLHDLSVCTMCVGIVCFKVPAEYSGGIENRWCLWNKKESSHVR